MDVAGDPVGQLLGGDGLGVEVVGGPEHGDEQLGVVDHGPLGPVVEGELLAGEVDESTSRRPCVPGA